MSARMLADGALLGRFGANMDMAAYCANPNLNFFALKDLAIIDTLGQKIVALLMSFLDSTNALKEISKFIESFFASSFSKILVHV